jgi:Protein of unknown function (DUF2795)
MERVSSKHSPRVDEEMSHEVRGVLQGTAGARAEEWKLAEPPGEDQPEATTVPEGEYRAGSPGGVGHGVGREEKEQLSRLGRYIGLSALPGDRQRLRRSAEDLEAPDDILSELDELPPNVTFRTVADVWRALGHEV